MSSVADKLKSKSPRTTTAKSTRLKLVYIDFWSAAKLAFLVSFAAGIVLVVASSLIWIVLASTGIFEQIDSVLTDIVPGFAITEVLGLGQVFLFAVVVALLNVVIGTLLGIIGTLLYNLSVRVTGGIVVGFTSS